MASLSVCECVCMHVVCGAIMAAHYAQWNDNTLTYINSVKHDIHLFEHGLGARFRRRFAHIYDFNLCLLALPLFLIYFSFAFRF